MTGFTTYYPYGDSEIRHVSYFWKILEHCFPPKVKSSVKGLRMSKDSKGMVFDLPSDLSDVVKVCSSDIFKQCVCVGDVGVQSPSNKTFYREITVTG